MHLHELTAAYVDICRGLNVRYFVTLATHRDGTLPGIRKLAANFCARVDRRLLGTSWSKKPAEARTDGIFFVEHVASNIHLHALLRLPSGTEEGLRMTSVSIWNTLCPTGTIDWQAVDDLPRRVGYCVKERRFTDYSDDQVFLVRELMHKSVSSKYLSRQ